MSQLSRGSGPDLWVAGRGFYSRKTIVLHGNGSSNFCTLRKGNATSGYSVPTGKKLVILAVKSLATGATPNTSATTSGCNVGYGDTDVGFLSASAPTNAVWNGGSTANLLAFSSGSIGVGVMIETACQFEIPASKFVAGRVDVAIGAGQIIAYGVLEDV